jgi:hypothetical protein
MNYISSLYKIIKELKMKKLFVLCFCLLIVSCTNSKNVSKFLDKEGYTEIEITGYQWFSCSKDDWFHTGFKATNMKGNVVEGTVCEGLLFKGKTIRFE